VGDVLLDWVKASEMDGYVKWAREVVWFVEDFRLRKAEKERHAINIAGVGAGVGAKDDSQSQFQPPLELLTAPTTRLARYPLLLAQILKYTQAPSMGGESPDAGRPGSAGANEEMRMIAQVMGMLKGHLEKVDEESGRSMNIVRLLELRKGLKGDVEVCHLLSLPRYHRLLT
jgi:hypothetical protein